MDYIVEKLDKFQLIGVERIFSAETSYQDIPQFWDEFIENQCVPLWNGKAPESAVEKAIYECNIGEFGVCMDDLSVPGKFRYLIAGRYAGREIPDGLSIITLPPMEWAKFRCSGPMPEALQSVNTKIFKEWLPGNTEFEIAMWANIEWYSLEKDTSAPDYESEIWIPVKRK